MSINKDLDMIIEAAVAKWKKAQEEESEFSLLLLDYYSNDVQGIEKKIIKLLAWKGIKAEVLYIPDKIDYKSILRMEVK